MLLVDQSGTETLFGDARQLRRSDTERVFRSWNFPSNVAVAPNAEASLLLARSYAGVTQVDEKDVQAKLAPLPLSDADCRGRRLSPPWGAGVSATSESWPLFPRRH